ncbi:glycoside hydrolase family 88 protein [Escherichia albertii]|uniref:Glycosyl hydrolase n=1 Tax=Escherichia coli TaxID=562 RepID=A0A765X3G5_ECOLX|nr:glycoside hydrolase family 88 protein [Escherichia albertii]EEU9598310.1 glycosyl hydrolase [Escherichia albertii]EEW0764259.1 glycosyl hydrolase [Escherichia albertii]EFF0801585.1 glycosyl hydrolase [Escherichia albertii]EGM7732784.1 glycosyl hydrolase [Escherichia albertii]EHW5674244.1 glycoside hydrolase family 88 protein [Escherichia albertii]
MKIDNSLTPHDLLPAIERMWEVSARKIIAIDATADRTKGAPVHTIAGRYQPKGWTDWTQGFEYGSALLQFDATGERSFLETALTRIRHDMPQHITHFGVHDHGFNQISTYGQLLRLMAEGKLPTDPGVRDYYQLAVRCSGAVQAYRWTDLGDGQGYIHSFNGAHSLFIDTLRTLRTLLLAHSLGHVMKIEGDVAISLLDRALTHALTSARYCIFYGEGRDIYDIRGRTAHEAIFNPRNGAFRCVGTQQGYSGFSTWTRGLSWAMCGFAEILEYLQALPAEKWQTERDKTTTMAALEKAAAAVCDFYLDFTLWDGIPYWDTGAPGLATVGAPYDRESDPENAVEPVDSSAAAIAAQGLLRFAAWLRASGRTGGDRYYQAGLSVLRTLLDDRYLSLDRQHQGLLLHSQYHRPNGWDYVRSGHKNPFGEATMWGDYHLRELALYVQRLANNEPYVAFFSAAGGDQ